MEEEQQGSIMATCIRLGLTSILLAGWTSIGGDPQRSWESGGRFWNPVPVYQHCLCSRYVFDKLFEDGSIFLIFSVKNQLGRLLGRKHVIQANQQLVQKLSKCFLIFFVVRMCNLCAFLDSKEVHTATMRIPVFLNLGIAETKQ